MNLIKWIIDKPHIEYKLHKLKKDNEKQEEQLTQHLKWQRSYLDHIEYLKKENVELKKEKEKIKYKKLLTETYDGTINIEFFSKDPHDFMRNLIVEIIDKLENSDMKVTDYSFSPKELSHKTYLGRTLSHNSTKFDDDYFMMTRTLNDLEFDLETICMYGDEEDFKKCIEEVQNVIIDTRKKRKQITEEDLSNEV